VARFWGVHKLLRRLGLMEMTWKKMRVCDRGCRGCTCDARSLLDLCINEEHALINADRSGARSSRSSRLRGRDYRSLERENGIPDLFAICLLSSMQRESAGFSSR